MNDKISVVIISKNEEKNIDECIRSVFEALNNFVNYEIFLVDSASSDNTIKKAMKYPINIFKLKNEWKHSASAGFYLGYLNSSGKYICFLAGDMILHRDWFKLSIPFLEKNDIGGVSGRIVNIFPRRCKNLATKIIKDNFRRLPIGEVRVLGGPTFYKKHVLDQVGPFHPFIKAGEEAELSFRVKEEGYKLVRLPIIMTYHFFPCISFKNYVSKYHWNYVKNVGSSLRYTFNNDIKIFYKRFKEIIVSLALLFYFINTILSLTFFLFENNNIIFYLLIGYSILMFILILKRKNLQMALIFLLLINIEALAKCIGFFYTIPKPEEYPTDAIRVKIISE